MGEFNSLKAFSIYDYEYSNNDAFSNYDNTVKRELSATELHPYHCNMQDAKHVRGTWSPKTLGGRLASTIELYKYLYNPCNAKPKRQPKPKTAGLTAGIMCIPLHLVRPRASLGRGCALQVYRHQETSPRELPQGSSLGFKCRIEMDEATLYMFTNCHRPSPIELCVYPYNSWLQGRAVTVVLHFGEGSRLPIGLWSSPILTPCRRRERRH